MASVQSTGHSGSFANKGTTEDTTMEVEVKPTTSGSSSSFSSGSSSSDVSDTTMEHSGLGPGPSSSKKTRNGRKRPAPASGRVTRSVSKRGLASAERKYRLEDFEFLRTIGTGTFGQVCLCRDKMTDKYMAMKILSVADVIRLKQVEHVRSEKSVLKEISHPFLVSLHWHAKDSTNLFMLLDYVSGGELFTYLRSAGRFSQEASTFYAAEIVDALDYLHSLNIVYRDLKPENLLLERDGHVKIADFGFAKKLTDRTWTVCGTPEYLAPEVIQSKGHNKAVDWWALGILIYEMLVGHPPFFDNTPFGIYEKILEGKIEWVKCISPVSRNLIKKLLSPDRTKRIGNMRNGAGDIKNHRWFKHINWNDVYSKKLKPPIVPRICYEGDTSNFDKYPDIDWKSMKVVKPEHQKLFEDF